MSTRPFSARASVEALMAGSAPWACCTGPMPAGWVSDVPPCWPCAALWAPSSLPEPEAALPGAGRPAVFHGCSINRVMTPAKSRITAKLAATKPAKDTFFFFFRGGWPRRTGALPGRWGGLCAPARRVPGAPALCLLLRCGTGAGCETGISTEPSGTSAMPRRSP